MTNNTERIKVMKISSNKALNDLLKEQELCLIKLVEMKDRPLKDKWEWAEWHREAIALELSHTEENWEWLDDEAIWQNLIKGTRDDRGEEVTKEEREFIIYILHNFLEIQFSKARQELAIREPGEPGQETE